MTLLHSHLYTSRPSLPSPLLASCLACCALVTDDMGHSFGDGETLSQERGYTAAPAPSLQEPCAPPCRLVRPGFLDSRPRSGLAPALDLPSTMARGMPRVTLPVQTSSCVRDSCETRATPNHCAVENWAFTHREMRRAKDGPLSRKLNFENGSLHRVIPSRRSGWPRPPKNLLLAGETTSMHIEWKLSQPTRLAGGTRCI